MPGGSSLHLVSNKREAMAASVTIALTNKTNEVLEARRQWVKGGEAVNLAVSYGPWGFLLKLMNPKMETMIGRILAHCDIPVFRVPLVRKTKTMTEMNYVDLGKCSDETGILWSG